MMERVDHDPWEGLADLPGGALVRRGIEARVRGERGSEALLVSLASMRLGAADLTVPLDGLPEDREWALYEVLFQELQGSNVDAYGRYNSLKRELDSFLAALATTGDGRPARSARPLPGLPPRDSPCASRDRAWQGDANRLSR